MTEIIRQHDAGQDAPPVPASTFADYVSPAPGQSPNALGGSDKAPGGSLPHVDICDSANKGAALAVSCVLREAGTDLFKSSPQSLSDVLGKLDIGRWSKPNEK